MTRIDYINLLQDAISKDSVKQFTDEQLYSIQIISAGLNEMTKLEFKYRKEKAAAQGIGQNSM